MMHARHGRFVAAIAAVIGIVAVLAPVASAKEPAAGYEQFAGCPTKEEKATITSCFHAEITGGSVKLGNKTTNIAVPFTLSGGTNAEGNEFTFNSKGGLSKAAQKVSGGVIGLTGLTWLAEILGSNALTLYAVTELAGPVGNPLAPNFNLPIKVHLINPVLGNNCYVGSASNPIELNLAYTTPPTPSFDPVTKIQHLDNGVQTDESFSAPGANGCVLTLFGFLPIDLDGVVDLASSLPSASGNNKAVQNVNAEVVSSKRVYP